MPSRWDKGLDYEATYTRLLNALRRYEGRKLQCYVLIALIELRNGSRISEAIRAFKEWVRTGKTELYILVSKKRKPVERLMVIPPEIQEYRLKCVDLVDVDDNVLSERVRVSLHDHFKINPHSLRYAYITYLLRQGVNPAIVSKLIKHSRLDTLLSYVQEKIGEKVLRELG
jgi:integrase